MPPKAQPRRQQPPRGAARANVEEHAEAGFNHERQGAPSTSEAADVPERTMPRDEARTSPASTTTATVSSLPRRRLPPMQSRKGPGLSAAPEASDSRSAGLKYQPKSNVRRTKAEREAVERAEAEKRQSRLAEAEGSTTSVSDRGGFHARGGRGLHGGGMGRLRSGEASGHLGGSSISEGGRKKKNARGGGLFSKLSIPLATTSTTDGSSALKKEPKVKPERDKDGDVLMGTATSRRRQGVKEEEQGPTYISSDEEPDTTEGPRVNIEHINLISDEDTDTEKDEATSPDKDKDVGREAKTPGWSLKPVRIDRHEHVERVVGINTDASSMTSAELRRRAKARGDAEGSLFLPDDDEPELLHTVKAKGKSKLKDVEFVRDERRWKGVYQEDEDQAIETTIKAEPTDNDDMMLIDEVADASVQAQSLAADSEAVAPKVATTEVFENANAEDAKLHEDKKSSQRSRSRLIKPVLQTEEDRQEWARYEEDLRILGEELGSMKEEAPLTQPLNVDEDLQKSNYAPKFIKDKREGLVYLFQLPPIMPKIVTVAEKEILLKPKQDEKAAEHQRHDRKKGDAKPPASDVKSKSDAEEPAHGESKSANAFMAQDLTRPVGRVGKLRVHESGRVMATWGGACLELSRGGEGGLLQELVMTDYERDLSKVEEGKEKGKERWEERISLGANGWAVGQLGGGFVMVPDWGRIFGL